MDAPATFSLEALARRSAAYLSSLVDARGMPYFDVFWDSPSLAAHDWPDFVDVTSRQLQAAVMLRRMTGSALPVEEGWRRRVLSYIDPADGVLWRPASPWSTRNAEWGDASLALYALVTDAADAGRGESADAAARMVDGLAARAARGDMPKSFLGFMVKPLVAAARRLDSAKALDLAGRLLGDAFAPGRLFTGGNAFVPGAHMHGTLRTLVGAADWALLRGDAGMLDRVTEIARWVRGIGTRFGFLPECWMRGGDIVSCETCALMDWAGLGATLAHAGRTEFWGPMERLARNHLAESQLRDAAWLAGDDAREDTDQFTWRGLPARLPGAWAGWSSPTHFLAARETLNAHWGGPELRDRTRALQNCCGGSGVHGLYILWKSSAVFDAGTLHVHMHLDRALPQAEVRCLQPWRGLTRVALREACRLRIRVPDFAPADRVRVRVDGRDVRPAVAGGYASLDGCRPGQVVEMEYPVAETSEEIAVGNPGWRQYRYRVTWKGDTVVAVRPQGDVPATGWSDFDKADVPVFYGEDGPCRIYRRDAMRAEAEPALAPLRVEDGGADFWRL